MTRRHWTAGAVTDRDGDGHILLVRTRALGVCPKGPPEPGEAPGDAVRRAALSPWRTR